MEDFKVSTFCIYNLRSFSKTNHLVPISILPWNDNLKYICEGPPDSVQQDIKAVVPAIFCGERSGLHSKNSA